MSKKFCIVTCHGFTGYPAEMESIGRYLQDRGFDWKNLQLPGHGTTPEDLKTKKWTDWTNYILSEVDQCLKDYNDNVFMIGLSLGGVMTLYTLINRPKVQAGICLATPVNIAKKYQKFMLKLPFIGFFLKRQNEKIDIFDPEMKKKHKSYSKSYPSSVNELITVIDYTASNLSKVTNPLLIIQSKKDQIVDYHNAKYIFDRVQSEQKELFYVDKSSHVLTEDYDKDEIFVKIYDFLQKFTNQM